MVFFHSSHCLKFLLLLSYPPDFKFNPRQYVNNTDTLLVAKIPCPSLWQDSTFSPPQPFILFSLPLLIPLSSPLLSHGCFQTDLWPMCTRCPPHSTPSRSLSLLTSLFDTDRWNCYQYWLLCLSQPMSPTRHTVYFVFLFLMPYQVKNNNREREWKEREGEREMLPLQPTYGPKPRVFLSDILSNVLSL